MKQIVLILMSLLTFSNPSKAQKQTADTDRAVRQENPCSLFLLYGDHRESGNRYRKRDWR